jgi:hypothetical protein
MTTAAIVLAAVLAVAAVLWVARPLLVRDDRTGEPEADAAAAERLQLLEERDRALAALKELEFDHRTGKISDTDYAELVRPLREDAAAALAALDAVTGAERAAPPDVAGPAEPEDAEPGPQDPAPNGSPAERQERPG